MRIIMHVDLDAFFASVEEREHPEFKGKPIVVGADPKEGKGRGVVSTCNYLAREYGIRSGMPIARAWRRCPDAVYLPVNMELYRKVSQRIMKILRVHADKFQQVSIDEAYLDVSKRVKDFEEAKELAMVLKRKIKESEALTCSIGIGPNKLVAKIASGFQKPDGLTVVKPEEVESFLTPLSVREIPGIGRKTARRLQRLGVKTIGELASCDPSMLRDEFGVWGIYFWHLAHGRDESEVEERGERKSLGFERTFDEDTSDRALIFDTLDELCTHVHNEVLKNKYFFKTVEVKIRYEDFETHTHAKTLAFPTNRLEDVKKVAHQLITPFLEADKKVRLIGVRISGLLSDQRQKRLLTI